MRTIIPTSQDLRKDEKSQAVLVKQEYKNGSPLPPKGFAINHCNGTETIEVEVNMLGK